VVTVGFTAASVKSKKHRIVAAVPRCFSNGADIRLEQAAGIDAAASDVPPLRIFPTRGARAGVPPPMWGADENLLDDAAYLRATAPLWMQRRTPWRASARPLAARGDATVPADSGGFPLCRSRRVPLRRAPWDVAKYLNCHKKFGRCDEAIRWTKRAACPVREDGAA
jgi:hypothetical protein